MSCFLQLSKAGDLLSLAPILHHEFLTNGSKPNLVVSKQYRQIPEALSYVNPIIYDGDPHDLEGAIKFAKGQCDDVKVTQLHGRGFEFQHRHPSFQYDQWDRAGMLAKWDTLPLALPRTKEPLRFLEKQMISGPFILYGDHSQSSPFWHKEALAEALKEAFPQHQLLRLSAIRAPHALELLALIDAADLFICVDSMPLHLSAASQTPVIALVTDNASRWHGSAFSKRFALHCRYGDFPRRKDELVRVSKRAIEGSKLPPVTLMDTNRNGYNPTIIQHGNLLLSVDRYHPARKWHTRLGIYDGQSVSDIQFPEEFKDASHEDCRLFHHQGKLMLTYVLARSEPVSNRFKTVIGYGMLVQRESRWHVEKHIQPKYVRNDWSGVQKNWVPFEYDGAVHFIYGNHFKEQIVLRMDGDEVKEEIKAPEPTWDHGEIRGGVVLPHGTERLLRFFHSRSGGAHWVKHGAFQYHVGALLMEAKPPFKVLQVGKYPILSGDERYVPGVHHWKPNVAMLMGAVKQGNDYLVSIGRNDSSAELVKLTFGDLGLT